MAAAGARECPRLCACAFQSFLVTVVRISYAALQKGQWNFPESPSEYGNCLEVESLGGSQDQELHVAKIFIQKPLAFCSVLPQREVPCRIRVACSLLFNVLERKQGFAWVLVLLFCFVFCTLRRKQQTGTEKPLQRNLFINYSFSHAQL